MVDKSSKDDKGSKIGQFYAGKTVFITGATGFMGKVESGKICSLEYNIGFVQVLVEKLLRSTKVKKILVLIRPKKGLETKVRLEELMSAKIFDKIKESSPYATSRVEAISGDITEHNFGLSQDDEK